MSDFELTYTSVEEVLSYPVLVSIFEGQAEQRRARSDKKVIGFQFTVNGLTKSDMQSYRTFFNNKKGMKTGFTWTSPFDDVEYTVRFNEDMISTYEGGEFGLEWSFRIIDQDES